MRSLVVLGALLHSLGCAPPRAAEPTSAASISDAAPVLAAQNISPPIASSPGRKCPLEWALRDLHTVVAHIPAKASALMMAPAVSALCACTQAGSHHAVTIELEPSLGSVAARSNDDDLALDACLAARLGPNLYPPTEITSDCIDCGPRRYGVFGGPPPPPPPRNARTRIPFSVDRRGE